MRSILFGVRILSSTSVPFTLTTMQVPNIALVETGQIAVQVVFIEPNAKDRPPEYKNIKKSLSIAVCGRLRSGVDRSWKTGCLTVYV
jgi:hypothetical protein